MKTEKKLFGKYGRWIMVEDPVSYWYECSECGQKPLYKFDAYEFSNYCPYCGARMERNDENS